MLFNVASDLIQEMARRETPEMKDRLMDALRRTFRPEVLNRIDEIVTFKSLGPEQIEKIVEIQLRDLQKRLADRKIPIELTDEARKTLGRARLRSGLRRPALKRTIQRRHPRRSSEHHERQAVSRFGQSLEHRTYVTTAVLGVGVWPIKGRAG